jgi:SAM-dependent methyltransferase
MFLTPRWTKERYAVFYEKEYDSYYRPSVINKDGQIGNPGHYAYSYAPIYERLQEHSLLPRVVENILDVGSGDGSKLEYFMEKFPASHYYAIEPSAQCELKLKAKGIEFLGADIDGVWESKSNKYDIVIMRHVLEHFMDPVAVMTKIRSVLSEHGIVYVAVPNCINPVGKNLSGSFFRVVHTYYFTMNSLSNVFRKAGLEPVYIRGGDHFHGELFAIGKLSNNIDPLEISKEAYYVQRKIYLDQLRIKNSLIYHIKAGFKDLQRSVCKLCNAFSKSVHAR